MLYKIQIQNSDSNLQNNMEHWDMYPFRSTPKDNFPTALAKESFNRYIVFWTQSYILSDSFSTGHSSAEESLET